MNSRALILSIVIFASNLVGFAQDSADVIVYGTTPGGYCAAIADNHFVIAAMEAGADGYLLKESGTQRIVMPCERF